MDFFQAQDSARRRTHTLLVLFIVAVAGIIASVYLVVQLAFMIGGDAEAGVPGTLNPGLLLAVATATILLVVCGSAYRTSELRRGGSAVAEMLGGRQVRSNTKDEHERRLVNVVEEMAIASGTPVPAIYVLDKEDGINAFAAGHTLDDAAVAVTRGAIETLTREELQGVIAHEFSHILNGDMRLNIRLIGMLFGILLLAIFGRGLLEIARVTGGRRRGKNQIGGQVALIGLGLIIIGYIGVFFGRLIQAAVSRQREFLADAAAVQFTRNPGGLGGALSKIASLAAGSKLQTHHSAEASHLFFANGVSKAAVSFLATHPPLDERIRRLGVDPSAITPRAATASIDGSTATKRIRGETAFAGGAGLVASVGQLGIENVAAASRLMGSIPEPVRAAAHNEDEAQALLFALLLDRDHADGQQRTLLLDFGGAPLVAEVDRLRIQIEVASHSARLSLLDMLMPALKELPPPQRTAVRAVAGGLIRSDGEVDMFEFAVHHMLHRQLEPEHDAASGATVEIHSIADARADAETIFTGIARTGSDDEESTMDAYVAAISASGLRASPVPVNPRAVTIDEIDAALERLRHASPSVRKQLMTGCVAAAMRDRRLSAREEMLLRALGEGLGCPVPLSAGG